MAAILDSVVEFRARLAAFKLDEFTDRFAQAGVETFADLAFMSLHQPNSGTESTFVGDVVQPILGDANHKKKGRLRRLFTEA